MVQNVLVRILLGATVHRKYINKKWNKLSETQTLHIVPFRGNSSKTLKLDCISPHSSHCDLIHILVH
jgi:hypothetical protein